MNSAAENQYQAGGSGIGFAWHTTIFADVTSFPSRFDSRSGSQSLQNAPENVSRKSKGRNVVDGLMDITTQDVDRNMMPKTHQTGTPFILSCAGYATGMNL